MYADKYKFMTVGGDSSLEDPGWRWWDVVIHPLSSFRKWWDLVIIALATWAVVVDPVREAFFWHQGLLTATNAGFSCLNIALDFVFITELLLNFNTASFEEPDQVLVTTRRRIVRNYLAGWFPVDLVSCLPLDLILVCTEAAYEGGSSISKGLKVLKVMRLLR